MATDTKIEWCDHTFNPWIGCTKVSPGCDHCYAQTLMEVRHKRAVWGRRPVLTADGTWSQPRKWERAAETFRAKHGRHQRVFCSSLADVFDNKADDAWRGRLGATILNTPSLEWLLLTKRIGNAVDMLANMFSYDVPANVRAGATIVNQEEAARDLGKIRAVAAVTKLKPFLSMEPLLGQVSLAAADPAWHQYVGWVIVGGESGPGARPMHPDWVRALRDECAEAGVPFLFKQWGEWAPLDHVKLSRDLTPAASLMLDGTRVVHGGAPHIAELVRVGKKEAGRLLDGSEHNGFPEAMVA
ncbi:phage Gp37/Gp68 family protein [Novosphingobium soli]|uniref:Phage Gp37/Gp68 family protein n=1 Tax=Novosphingobium soli TaxID=574956 RepID=A0ABV6CXH5_9SPHN